MAVRIHLSPFLRKFIADYDHESGILLQNCDGWTVQQIIEIIKIPPKEVLAIMVNSYPAKTTSAVTDGDTVTLSKFIAGG